MRVRWHDLLYSVSHLSYKEKTTHPNISVNSSVQLKKFERCVLNWRKKKNNILRLNQLPQTFQSLKSVVSFDSLISFVLHKPEDVKVYSIQMVLGTYPWQLTFQLKCKKT